MDWFSVRCVFEVGEGLYEERITLWMEATIDDAIARAEAEAAEYVSGMDFRYLGLTQAFKPFAPPGVGAEIFSLIRGSELSPEEYLATFFDTGTERQTHA
jgi:hypothetical protein